MRRNAALFGRGIKTLLSMVIFITMIGVLVSVEAAPIIGKSVDTFDYTTTSGTGGFFVSDVTTANSPMTNNQLFTGKTSGATGTITVDTTGHKLAIFNNVNGKFVALSTNEKVGQFDYVKFSAKINYSFNWLTNPTSVMGASSGAIAVRNKLVNNFSPTGAYATASSFIEFNVTRAGGFNLIKKNANGSVVTFASIAGLTLRNTDLLITIEDKGNSIEYFVNGDSIVKLNINANGSGSVTNNSTGTLTITTAEVTPLATAGYFESLNDTTGFITLGNYFTGNTTSYPGINMTITYDDLTIENGKDYTVDFYNNDYNDLNRISALQAGTVYGEINVNTPATGTVFIPVLYDSNNNMIEVKPILDTELVDGKAQFNFTGVQSTNKIRIFEWDSLTNIEPLAHSRMFNSTGIIKQ